MTSRLITIAGLLCFSCLFFFCKKDEPSIAESPFFDFFNESSIIIDTVSQSADAWEYGFTFTPLKSGKITQLGIKIPATGDFTVTLWDLSGTTPVILKSKAVSSGTQHVNANSDIPDIALIGGTKYGITVLSNAFYRISRPGNSKFIFPKTIGSIRIEGFNETVNNTSLAMFPTMTNDTRVAPCVNVVFIAD